MLKRLNHVTDQLYEFDLVRTEIEHKEPMTFGIFILQYGEQTTLERYYNFFRKFHDADKYKELEMVTLLEMNSLYLTETIEIFEDVILPEKRDGWNAMRSRDCTDIFAANVTDNFFPRMCCNTHEKHDKRELGLFKEEFRCTEMLCLCSITYFRYDRKHK